jgi:acetyl-CoA acetyltransferase
MAEEVAVRGGYEVLAYLEDVVMTAVSPNDGLLMAPVTAVPRLLARHGLSVDQVDRFEIHEAFGAQVCANLHGWHHGWIKTPEVAPIGEVPREKINRAGGSLALGHPFGATGGRLLLSLATMLRDESLSTGVISVCAAGGMACAMLLRR